MPLQSVTCFSLAILALSVLLGSAGQAIIDGARVTSSEVFHSSTVLLKDSRNFCTGTILDSEFVLTAAHCSFIQPGQVFFSSGASRKILKTIPHPRFIRENEIDDLMLVQFAGGLPEGTTVAEIPDRRLFKLGDEFVVVGFGSDGNGTKGILRKTSLQISSIEGNEMYTDEFAGPCDGDSGGPVFFLKDSKWWLVGAISRGPPSCNSYRVYEDLSAYKKWIMETIQIHASK